MVCSGRKVVVIEWKVKWWFVMVGGVVIKKLGGMSFRGRNEKMQGGDQT